MKLIEKKISKATFVIEFDEEELKTIWGDVSNAAFNCEQTYKTIEMAKNDNMLARIKYEKSLASQLSAILHGESF